MARRSISRLRGRGPLAFFTVATLLTVGTGLASAGEEDASPTDPALTTPTLNPEKTKKAAITYLMGKGVSAQQAELRIKRQPEQLAAAERLRQQAPQDIQDVWIDDNGQLVANVLDEDGEKAARAAGAEPRFVTLAGEDLQAVIDELTDDTLRNPPANFSGASFEIDNETNKVLARYMFTQEGGTIPALATQRGDTVTATAEVATLTTTAKVEPGQTMSRDGDPFAVCSTGWAVDIVEGGKESEGVMTAGHCFDLKASPESSVFSIDTFDAGDTKGTGKAFTFGTAGDFGFLQLRDGDQALAQVGTDEKLVRAIEQDPIVGATVCQKGRTTGETCGKVLRTKVTKIVQHNDVNFLVKNQVRADFCAQGGDSGGPVYAPFESEAAAPGVAAMGIQSSAIAYLSATDVVDFVCGENANPPKPNESDFTPLSNIDNADKFFVKIAGG